MAPHSVCVFLCVRTCVCVRVCACVRKSKWACFDCFNSVFFTLQRAIGPGLDKMHIQECMHYYIWAWHCSEEMQAKRWRRGLWNSIELDDWLTRTFFPLLMQVCTVKKTSMNVHPTHVTMAVCALTWSMALCAHAHGATMTPSASLTLTSVRPTRVSMVERVEMEWTGLYFCFSPPLAHTVIVLSLIHISEPTRR